ncbi:penicillin-binding protein 1A [Pleomorphomonas carboxyditropha]|uniref:Penicillin-binding protein 1A n=1 Tax=Pleomorphomonas carboxyditropha TaxID=2023338 RepID=A0A2G9WTV0_9HYPH|nr:penicillin-binding protein 1A [Pleomorphomonas carboxyditropha]PIO97712.1 penicillin-binding protein [Pleomorphomonas carboxyditropha]
MVFVRFFGWVFSIAALLLLVAAGGVAVYIHSLSSDLPDTNQLRNYQPPVVTRVHAADGELASEYAHERRLFLPIQMIPDRVKQAFISAEDKVFYTHPGIDLISLAGAAVKNLDTIVSGSNKRMVGASTITQQVAKVFLLTNERTIDRKIREAMLTLKIEQTYTKDQILELYLNEIYLGFRSYGVAAASLAYFDKPLSDLKLEEVAYLAALPKAPENYNPYRSRQAAVERRNYVIEQMVQNGYVTREEGDAALKAPLVVAERNQSSKVFASDYFVEEVRRSLLAMYGEKGLYEGGLSVRTTLDPKMQVVARSVLQRALLRYDEAHGWRGANKQIEVSGDWGIPLAAEPALSDVPEWNLAVVLGFDGDAARVGLQPSKGPTGKVNDERVEGVIPLDQLKWARWQSGPKRGAPVKAASDVLSVGDVIYVEKTGNAIGTLEAYRLRQFPGISGALVAMDSTTGRVRAMVGGFSFAESEFNRATQAMRQPGSSFKPFVYSAALDNGYTPASVIMDAPVEIDQGAGLGIWRPQNYGGGYIGPATLRTGIEQSRNLMTVRLAQDMGMPLVAEYARRFGIYDNMQPVLAMSLGAGETTVMRLVNAYAIIANGGRRVQPTLIDRVQDRFGRTIYKHDQRVCEGCNADDWKGQDEPQLIDEREQVLDPMTAYQITSMMEGVVQRGTATVIRSLNRPIAGKTGTTNDEKDAWFVGFTPELTVGIFLGFDTPKPMGHGSTGGTMAAPVFRDFMEQALAGQPPQEFKVPEGMTLIPINRKTGMRAYEGESAIIEAFKPGTGPSDIYSVIGGDGVAWGVPTQVNPEADKAAVSGTGGLY